MRRVVLVFITGCGGSNATPIAIDAGHGSGSNVTCSPRPNLPECGSGGACGNGVVDVCVRTVPPSEGPPCPAYQQMTEVCDGTDVPSTCIDIGYFGGTSACTAQCRFDDHGCTACAQNASVAECVTSAGMYSGALASTGGYLALAPPQVGATITIFDDAGPGLETLATTSYADTVEAIVGVPGGWLVKTSDTVDLHALANNGTHLADHAASLGSNAQMVYGPGGHAMVLWQEQVNSQPELWAAIVAANADTVVAPFVLSPPSDDNLSPALTTDGTSFFVGVRGQVMRLDANGSVASTSQGFPMIQLLLNGTVMSWSGTTGWYVIPEDIYHVSSTAQAFDATGAPIGMPASINLQVETTEWTADHGALLAVTSTSVGPDVVHLSLVRIDATGALVSTTEFGAADLGAVVHLAPFDATHMAATWDATGKRQLALVVR